MKDDFISRQAAIDAINTMFAPTPTQMDIKEDCLEIIENLPSALPKRHGRLIDADALLSKAKFLYKGYEVALTNTIGDAPTIIDANKEGEK